MSVDVKTDYVSEAQQLIRQAHRGKPKTMALLAGFMDVCQSAEYALQTLTSPYDVDVATGDKLTQIGSIFGVARSGLGDDQYRLFVQGAIAQRHCNGTLPDILRVTKTLYQADKVTCDSPLSAGSDALRPGGALRLSVGGAALPQALWPLARRLVAACVPAGISLDSIDSYAQTHVFAFAGTGEYIGGFGSTKDASIGAPLASAA